MAEAAKIHPTAVIDPSARIGAEVEVGPHTTIAADVVIGDRCRLLAFAVVAAGTALGEGNTLHPFVVLGAEAEGAGADAPRRGELRIGRGNVFREGVIVHRGDEAGGATVIGDDGYFMTGVHVEPNAAVGSGCILTNGCLLGRGADLGDRTVLSAHVDVRPYCRIGSMTMVQGNSEVIAHLPPYCMVARRSWVVGLNKVGLRRGPAISDDDRKQITDAFKLTFRSGAPPAEALAAMDARKDWGAAAGAFREFVRRAVSASPPYDVGLAAAKDPRADRPDTEHTG